MHARTRAAALDVAPSAVAHQAAVAVGLADGNASEDAGWAFVRLIHALAREAPLMLVIDDAHQAKPGLIELLHDVTRLRDAPALIVCVTRHELFASRPAWAQHVLELGALSETAAATLLDAIAGEHLDADDERRIAHAASGNPLFLEQLVAYVDEHRSGDSLPPALHALLAARLDRLDTVERSALTVGAVAGDTFARAAIPALAGVTRAELEQACERLVRRDLLFPAGDSLRFRTRSCAKSRTRRSPSRRGPVCTSVTPRGWRAWTRRTPTRRSRSISRRRAGTGSRSAAARRPSSSRTRVAGWRQPPRWRVAAATSRPRSASSSARSRCSAPTARRAPCCCPRW